MRGGGRHGQEFLRAVLCVSFELSTPKKARILARKLWSETSPVMETYLSSARFVTISLFSQIWVWEGLVAEIATEQESAWRLFSMHVDYELSEKDYLDGQRLAIQNSCVRMVRWTRLVLPSFSAWLTVFFIHGISTKGLSVNALPVMAFSLVFLLIPF
jgi:hypothetical protein